MLEKITVRDVRNINKINAVRALISNKDLSRNDIANIVNISVMTVKNIIDPLLEKGTLTEKKTTDVSLVGRKPTVLNIVDTIGCIVLIDLTSKNSFQYYIYNIFREKISKGFFKSDLNLSYSRNIVNFIEMVKNEVAQLNFQNIAGIGIVVPGVYNNEADQVYNKLIKELNDIKLKSLIREYFTVDNIVIDHDVKLAALAEGLTLENNSSPDLYYLFIGEGVGGAFILNGEIYNGHNEIAGDIGQYLISGDGGNERNLESILACPAITKGVKESFAKHGLILDRDYNELEFDDLVEMYKKGNTIVVDYVDSILKILSRVVFNIIWLVNPNKIVLGSPNYEFSKIVAQKLSLYVKELLGKINRIDCEINTSKYEGNGALMGLFEILINSWIENI